MLAHEHLGYILPFYVFYSVKVSSSTETREAKDINLSLRIICGQIKPNERLVKNPTSQDRVLTCLQKWASYGPLEYFESWSKLKTFTAQKLKYKEASWHRQCLSGIRTPWGHISQLPTDFRAKEGLLAVYIGMLRRAS